MSLININLASQSTLTQLWGVGPVLAQRIVEWRTQRGYFPTVDALMHVPGIGTNILSMNRSKITVEALFFMCSERGIATPIFRETLLFKLETIVMRQALSPLVEDNVLYWESLQERARFEFEWMRTLTEMHIEVISELPAIPVQIDHESIQVHLSQINSIWKKERRVGRFLNHSADFVAPLLDWLNPRELTLKQQCLQAYLVGGVTWGVMNLYWMSDMQVVFRALFFPFLLLSQLLNIFQLGFPALLQWGLVGAVVYGAQRLGLRFVLLLWLLYLAG